MQKSNKIGVVIVLALCYLLPVDPAVVGFSVSSPVWTHFVYPFFHAGPAHLICNACSLYLILGSRLFPPRYLFPLLYGITITVSFLAAGDIPTVGASGLVFAMAGIRMCGVRRPSAWIAVTLSLVAGFFLPSVNAAVHLWAFGLGFVSAGLCLHINRLRYDSRAVSCRERKA